MGRKVIRCLAVLMLLGGIGVFFYPSFIKYRTEYESRKAIREFQAELAEQAEDAAPETAEDGASEREKAGSRTESRKKASGLEELRRELQAYNEQLYREGQANLRDPFDYESPSFDLTEYGFSQNIIGILWIPRMEIEIPVYLGANYDTMANGAGLLGQTSMPLGGENTNVVLAAHRGWKGIPMFRDIQALQLGDKIQITTPWDTLVYRVCELKIILPGDSDEILIQEGRDLVTLLTCHPYTQNYQRYLVVAERSTEEMASREEDMQEAEASYSAEPRIVKVIREDGEEEAAVDPWGIQTGAEEGAAYSNLQIWMEDYGMWIGFVCIIGIMFFMLLSVRKRKKRAGRNYTVGGKGK